MPVSSRHSKPPLGKSALDQLIDHRVTDRSKDSSGGLIVDRNGRSDRDIAAALDYHWQRLTRGTLWMAICKASNPTLDAAACTGHNS
jgi:hypothetical protein